MDLTSVAARRGQGLTIVTSIGSSFQLRGKINEIE